MKDAAKERYEQGLNPESFAHRVFDYVKLTNEAESLPKDHEKMDERRQHILLALAHEMSSFHGVFYMHGYDLWLMLGFFLRRYGGSDIVRDLQPRSSPISIVSRA